MASHRWVVCVDIDAESEKDSYSKLRMIMDNLYETAKDTDSGFEGWESTNEAYGPDGALDVDEVCDNYYKECVEEEADVDQL